MNSFFWIFNPQSAIRNPIYRRLSLILVFILMWAGLSEGLLYAMPPVQRMVLPNHLVVMVCEEHSLPFVTFQLLINSGSRQDPSGQEGLANLTARGLLLGTLNRSANTINEEVDFMGASLNASVSKDVATLSLRVLKKDLDKGFDLFMETLRRPAFPEEEIRREIEKTLAAIQSGEENPGEVARKEFQKALFLKSPYGHPIEGTKESVPRLRREAALRFYQAYYHPNNCILAVVGDVTVEEIKKKIIPHLIQWPMAEIPRVPFTGSFAKERKTIKIDRGITQANIVLGHAGISRDNPNFYPFTVMNYILGSGGFSSRLVEEIRIKRGLAYSVTSYFDAGKYPGSFQIVLQTKNSSAREAISIALQQMERIRKDPVSEKELEGAKKYLIGSFPMRLDTQGKLASFITAVEYHGLGFDYASRYPSLIQSVSKGDVLRVAQKYLFPEKTILVVVANLKEAAID
jgi:zinc protease